MPPSGRAAGRSTRPPHEPGRTGRAVRWPTWRRPEPSGPGRPAVKRRVSDLDLTIDIHIDRGGWGRLVHRHELLNLSDQPLSRINRELWFEHTREGRLAIEAINDGTRQISIQRIHDTPTMSTFACHLAPAVPPGEAATLQCICDGGRFVTDHYWRQTLARYTQHFTLWLRHQDAGKLRSATATEEQWDGSEPAHHR